MLVFIMLHFKHLKKHLPLFKQDRNVQHEGQCQGDRVTG